MTHTITRTVKLNQPTQAYQITGRGRNKTAHEIPVSKALNDVRRLITLIHDEVQSRLTLHKLTRIKPRLMIIKHGRGKLIRNVIVGRRTR